MQIRNRIRAAMLAAFMLPAATAMAQAEVSSFAFVQEDGSMRIGGTRVYLYGIYIPPTERSCSTFIRPVPCGPRAALALDFKISGDFVRCLPRQTFADGSIAATCRAGNDDLGLWMLEKGWAIARADAPFEYAAMENVARAQGVGIWGIPVDVIRRRGQVGVLEDDAAGAS